MRGQEVFGAQAVLYYRVVMETLTLNMTFFFQTENLKYVSQGNEKPLAVLSCLETQRVDPGPGCLRKGFICSLEFLELQFPKNLPSEWTLQRIHTTLALPQALSLTWFPHSFLVKLSQICVCNCHADTHTTAPDFSPELHACCLPSNRHLKLSRSPIKWTTFSPPQQHPPSLGLLWAAALSFTKLLEPKPQRQPKLHLLPSLQSPHGHRGLSSPTLPCLALASSLLHSPVQALSPSHLDRGNCFLTGFWVTVPPHQNLST